MEQQKNKVVVRIAGNEYTLVGIEAEDYIQRLAYYVDKKTAEVMKNNSRLSTSLAAVLTSINIADDYFKSAGKEQSLIRKLKHLEEENSRLREERKRLEIENADLNESKTALQLELAKREAELNEVRNTIKNNGYK